MKHAIQHLVGTCADHTTHFDLLHEGVAILALVGGLLLFRKFINRNVPKHA